MRTFEIQNYSCLSIMHVENGNTLGQCVKCPQPATFLGLNASAKFCQPCFHAAVRHKFKFVLGSTRMFRGSIDQIEDVVILYTGDAASRLLLSFVWQGMTDTVARRLRVRPTVMVYLTSSDANELNRQVNECLSMSVIAENGNGTGKYAGWRWIFIHAAAVIDTNELLLQLENDIIGLQKIADYTELLHHIKTDSARMELQRLLQMHLLARVARALKCVKVLVPDNMDQLSNIALNSLCLGRAASIADITGAIDHRIEGIKVLRPMSAICNREIESVNLLEGNNSAYFNNQPAITTTGGIQAINAAFLSSLQVDGFVGTLTNIMSISSKVEAAVKGDRKCPLCLSMFSTEVGHQSTDSTHAYCHPCSDLIDEIDIAFRDTILSAII